VLACTITPTAAISNTVSLASLRNSCSAEVQCGIPCPTVALSRLPAHFPARRWRHYWFVVNPNVKTLGGIAHVHPHATRAFLAAALNLKFCCAAVRHMLSSASVPYVPGADCCATASCLCFSMEPHCIACTQPAASMVSRYHPMRHANVGIQRSCPAQAIVIPSPASASLCLAAEAQTIFRRFYFDMVHAFSFIKIFKTLLHRLTV